MCISEMTVLHIFRRFRVNIFGDKLIARSHYSMLTRPAGRKHILSALDGAMTSHGHRARTGGHVFPVGRFGHSLRIGCVTE